MLDPVARVGPRVVPLGALDDVEGVVDGGVADRVGGEPETQTVGAAEELGELLDVPGHVAARLLAVVAARHRRGAADERAVGEHLDRADPQPFVAHPGAQAEVEALTGGVVAADDVVQGREVRHDRGAHAELSLIHISEPTRPY